MKPIIVGIETFTLTDAEKDLLPKINPSGIALFERNCQNPAQVLSLTNSLRSLLGNDNLKIFIDQEGGRIQRLKKPLFKEFPGAKFFADIAENDLNKAATLVYNNYQEMAIYLQSLGINGNFAPVADLAHPSAHPVIGDRSFGSNVEQTSKLAESCYLALLNNNVAPVLKHIPGHGRATIDSHIDLPYISTDLKILEETDFAVFKNLLSCPYAMTSHIIYEAIDPYNPATTSKKVINYIREEIGYKGIIMTDAIEMKALKNSIIENATLSIEAGCDLVLYCEPNISQAYNISKYL
jgi:beta-glucosidase-like glycosyl hydrolase